MRRFAKTDLARSRSGVRGTAQRRPPAAAAFLGLLLCLVLLPALSACGSSEPAREGETIKLVIPSGTTKLLKKGGTSDAIPDRITGRVGDTLVVVNEDEATQFIAGYSVSPDQTLKIPLNRAGSYITNCSAHKDSSIKMEIEP